MKSNLAILAIKEAVPLTKASSVGTRHSWSSFVEQERLRVRREASDEARKRATASYQEEINDLVHRRLAGEITAEEYKRILRKIKKKYPGVRK